MICFFKKYYKYLLGIFISLLMVLVFFYYKSNYVETNSVKKLSVSNNEIKSKVDKDNKITNKTVFVDVKGAVNIPGVYEIDSQKRIIDAINLAGGLSESANTINLNLSKKVEDEMYIIVYNQKQIDDYKSGETNKILCAAKECVCPDVENKACISNDKISSKKTSEKNEIDNTSNLISINSATKEELQKLSGIGESKASLIISYRQKNGPFKSIDEIKNVSGIGDALYEKIKDKITI